MVVRVLNSSQEFKTAINSGRPVVIDFWATWCGPCRAISPILETLSEQYEGVDFYKVDVDEQGEIAQEYGVKAMPTFMLFKDGNKADELVGAVPAKLNELVQAAVKLTA